MRKCKGLLSFILAFALILSTFSIPVSAAAAVRCYTINSGNTTVYSNTGLTNRYGAIYDTDEVTVLLVTGTYSKVSYPISRGRTKIGYIPTGTILTATSGNSYRAGARITTYRRPGGASYGYIDANDTVVVFGGSGNYTQVKYPVGNGYKYAFVTTSDVQNYITGTTNNSTSQDTSYSASTSQTSGKCYTISSGNTAVYSNTELTSRYGAIYGSDEVTVLSVNSSYSQVSYPITGGTKTGYIPTSAILTAVSGNTYSSKGRITTYRRPGGSTYGYIDQNDKVEVFGQSGNYTQVKYPVSGGYKYAFITTANANVYLMGSGGSTVQPQVTNSSQADALVNKAKSQIGVKERSARSDDIFYNDWFYKKRVNNFWGGFYPWCAVFVSWCANETGTLYSVIPRTAGTTDMKNQLISLGGTQHLKNSGYQPVHGDIIFFGSNACDHVGIVDKVSGNTVYYIDGNNTSTSPHGVHYSSCSLYSNWLWGFVTPAYRN